MAVKYYISNKIEKLINKFSINIKHKTDAFKPETIITQTPGMQQMITSEIAIKTGVFANYNFLKPDDLISRLFSLADLHPNYQFSRQQMQWAIYSLLSDENFITEFPHIASYYNDDLIKQSQLASKIADLFDQYMVYRPDFIEKWNLGSHPELEESNASDNFKQHEQWQSWLWLKLKEQLKDNSIDQVELKKQLLDKFKDNNFVEKVKSTYERISIIALSVLSPFHKEIFDHLAEIISLHYYLIDPAPESNWYLSDSEELHCNDILASFKTTGQHLFSMLFEDKSVDVQKLVDQKAKGKTLLEIIQQDICHNHHEGIKSISFDSKDTSLQIASSYTSVREVESLYNYLLKTIQDNSDLQLKDIVVLLAEPEKYAPYIKAVFNNGPVKLPYRISEQAFSEGDTLLNALEEFLSLRQNQFSTEAVFQLLESKYIRAKFDIEDIESLTSLVQQANIRFGQNGRKNDDTYLMSWQHGLSKLILSYAIKGDMAYVLDDETYYLPNNVEGNSAYDLFRLKAFVDTVFSIHERLHLPRTLIEWKKFLTKDVINVLFEINDSCKEEYTQILKTLESIDFIKDDFKDQIPFSVFRKTYINELSNEIKKPSYIGGGITFCPILPVRSIPYKVIAMLGMNGDVFPRKQTVLGFDLMNFEERIGDRNVRNNDKYLFLETLLAARKQLYLSYIGKSAQDNSELPPSLLVEELMDYLKLGLTEESINKHIIYNHPLHSFSDKYYSQDSKFYTYLGGEANNEIKKHDTSFTPDTDFDLINLDSLIQFFKEPFKWFYNKTLSIYYNDDDHSFSETEPFELDKLQEWKLKFDLVTLDEERIKEYLHRGKSYSLLPLGNMANLELDKQQIEIEEVRDLYRELTSNKEQSTFYHEIEFNGLTLRGSIFNLFGTDHVVFNASKSNSQAKYIIDAWLKHLFLTASDKAITTHYLSSELTFKIPETLIDGAGARHLLRQLIGYFRLGHTEIIPFTPKAGKALAQGIYNDPDKREDLIIKAINNIKKEGEIPYGKSFCDLYIAKEIEQGYFNDTDKISSDILLIISDLLFKPLFQSQILQ